MNKILLCLLALCLARVSTAQPLAAQDGLDAVNWVQTSAESKIAARQAYRLASLQLDAALRDKSWSAATEQVVPFGKLPPAIILDLDETILDNSFFQARIVRDDAPYSDAAWESWVAQSDAPALPGSVEFLNLAAKKGVQIFYVSNRGAGEEAATRENLRRIGCPLQGLGDHVLLNGERPDWTTNKTSRRRFVAQRHRVLLLVGDDMNDFLPVKPLSPEQRLVLAARFEKFWGERWILLSNPLYGSWQSALLSYRNDLSRQEILHRKYDALQTREPAAPAPPVTGAAR